MLWLTDYLSQLLYVAVVCAAGLWLNVLLEGARQSRSCARRSRTARRLHRRYTHLERRARALRHERDHWQRRSAYWERAYRQAVGHDGDDPHPTLSITAPVPTLKGEDAPVP